MSHHDQELAEKQEENTSKLVMKTFYKVANEEGTGVSAAEIARYLQDKFGEVWRLNTLTGKAENALRKSVALGFLERVGDRYLASMVREAGCCRRRRKRRRSCRRRRRRRCCPKRRRRRRSCCC